MNAKRLLLMAVFGAIATFIAPAAYATVANQGNITVEWNAQPIAKMTLTTNYTAAGASSASAPAVLAQVSGTGACSATGGGAAEPDNVTANFGNITPDSASNTDCLYKNGVNIQYSTTDSNGYNITAAEIGGSSTLPAGTSYASGAGANVFVCLADNGTVPTAAVTQSTRTTASFTQAAPGTCSLAGGHSVAATTPSGSIVSSASAQATTTNAGEDIVAQLGSTVTSGSTKVVVQFTLNNL